MSKTPDEIKRGLECCTDISGSMCPFCQYAENGYVSDTCREEMASDAHALIQQLEARNNEMYHTILGVMHFVDKWLNDAGYDPEHDADGSDAINRAAKAREIALRAIEEAEKRPTF